MGIQSSTYVNRLDLHVGDSGSKAWTNLINTYELSSGSTIDLLPLATFRTFVIAYNEYGNPNVTRVDEREYANNRLRLNRYYRYNNEDYQFCEAYLILPEPILLTEVSYSFTKGLTDQGWGEGAIEIIVIDEAFVEVARGGGAGIIIDGETEESGIISVECVEREAGIYYDQYYGEYGSENEVYYSGGLAKVAAIRVYCNNGIQG